MENKLITYTNADFGTLRTAEINGEVWFVGKDVAAALGYTDVNHSILDHVDEEDRVNSKTQGHFNPELGQRGGWLINESGLYSLVLSSKLPSAKNFKRWITHEVLPSIRRTGAYKTDNKSTDSEKDKRAEAQYKNACVKAANMYYKLAQALETRSAHYKDILLAKAAQELSGEMLIPLPRSEQRTYSASEVGRMLGVSANKIGKIANQNNLKSETYGQYYRDKSPYSGKEVDSFRYNDTAVEKFRALLGTQAETETE